MLAQYYVMFLLVIVTVIDFIAACWYLIFRQRTLLGRYSVLFLASMTVEMIIYLAYMQNTTSSLAPWLYILQIVAYLSVDVSYFLFILMLTGYSGWIKRRMLMILCFVPVLVTGLLVYRMAATPELFRILRESDVMPVFGPAQWLFVGFSNVIGLTSMGLLVFSFFKTRAAFHKYLFFFLLGTFLVMFSGMADLTGVNPFQPVSMLQVALAINSILVILFVFLRNPGSILFFARQALLRGTQEGYLVVDENDTVIDANRAVQKLLGRENEDLVGKKFDAILDTLPLLSGSGKNVLQSSGEAQMMVGKDDHSYQFQLLPVMGAQNEPLGKMILFRNVTGREQTEKILEKHAQELAHTNSFLSALAKIAMDLQILTDPTQIMENVGKELHKLGLMCFIAHFDPETDELEVVYYSGLPAVIRKIEVLTGSKILGFRLKRDAFFYLYDLLDSKGHQFHKDGLKDALKRLPETPVKYLEKIIRLIGISPGISTLVIPLVAKDKPIGLMGVWGMNLSEGDVPPYKIFASQLAFALERVTLYKEEAMRLDDLAHTNLLVTTLAKVASLLKVTTNSDLVLDTLGIEIKEIGLNCAVTTMEPSGESARIQYVSFDQDVLQKVERLIGFKIKNFAIPRSKWPQPDMDQYTAPLWYERPEEIFSKMFPSLAVCHLAFQILGFKDGDKLCLIPLVTNEKPMGTIAIWGSNLRQNDSPALNVFASQVAGVLKGVTDYAEETNRAREMARSNSFIISLSNVASRLNAASDFSQILEILGNELKNVGMNCMVGLFDDDRQNMTIQYFSIGSEIMRLTEKLKLPRLQDYPIPRRLWPTDRALTERAPYWDSEPIGSVYKMFPYMPKSVFQRSMRLIGFNLNEPICYLPMIIEEDVIGVLSVWGADLKQEDIPALTVFANQVTTSLNNTRLYTRAQEEIEERKLAEQKIRDSLVEKEILLKEIHHRVKNNLQVISSLLNLQAAQINDPKMVDTFRESQNRVRTMALIHEKLYQSQDLAHIEFDTYLNNLVNSLGQTYRLDSGKVAFHIEAEKIMLDIDTAIPCGLIVNELVSNSIKYAFPNGKSGTVSVFCRLLSGGVYSLVVQDDGIGMPPDLDWHKSQSLGLKLVSSLARQIDGKITLDSTHGTRFEVAFALPG